MVLGSGPLEDNSVIGWSPHDRISALIGRGRQSFLSLSCEDTKRRWPSVNQEEGFYQEPNHAGTLISDFQPLEL